MRRIKSTDKTNVPKETADQNNPEVSRNKKISRLDTKETPKVLLDRISLAYLNSEEVRNTIREKSSNPVIPRKKNSKIGNADIDWSLYKYRHLVENLFARIKHFRGIATRFDKLKRNYESVVALVCAFLWLPM